MCPGHGYRLRPVVRDHRHAVVADFAEIQTSAVVQLINAVVLIDESEAVAPVVFAVAVHILRNRLAHFDHLLKRPRAVEHHAVDVAERVVRDHLLVEEDRHRQKLVHVRRVRDHRVGLPADRERVPGQIRLIDTAAHTPRSPRIQ